MSSFQTITELSRRLADTLEAETVPARYKSLGAQLLNQLRNPVRTALLGLPGSGKTSLLRMMLGRADVPSIECVDLVEVSYGTAARTTFDFACGRKEEFDGLVSRPTIVDGVYRARLELPEDRLRMQAFAEIRLSGPESHRDKLLTYAAKSAEILVWCSETFDPTEQALWSAVPEERKANSFLVLTKADQQLMKGRLRQRIAELGELVSEDFYGLYPVATLQAIAARDGDRQAGSDLWKTSGGAALCQAVQQQIELGRAEDLDRATMLIDHLAPGGPANPRNQTASTGEEGISAQTEQPGPPALCEHDSEQDTEARSRPMREELHMILGRLEASAREMLTDMSGQETPDHSHVVEQCIAAVTELSETLASTDTDDPAAEGLLEDAREGEDMLLLLQLEKDENAAIDAVSLMLQLKKGMSA